MATRLVDAKGLATAERTAYALGGAPVDDPARIEGTHEKHARKQHKREAKRRRDAERPPESFEQWRILSEIVSEGRQVIDLADHKARYSLVVMGVLNAGVFFLMSRSHLLGNVSHGIKPWLIGFMVVYAALTFLFIYYAVDCLRPRRLQYADMMASNANERERDVPLGILFWETIAAYELEDYRQAWSNARMEQVNAEVVVIAHRQARLIRTKYASLGRLYSGLAGLIVLAWILLAVFTVSGLGA